MHNQQRTFILLGTFALLFFIGQLLFTPKAYLVSRLGAAFQAPVTFLRSVATRTSLMRDLGALSLENQSLRAQLHAAQNAPSLIKQNNKRYIAAPLYSSYPLTISSKLLIGGGTAAGILDQATVLAAPGIFLGQIERSQEQKAVVRTIFDPGWELAVKIGENQVDALLIGGQEPRLTLISKRKPLNEGESVYLVSRDFPHGLTLGTVAELRQSKDSLFFEGRLLLPYAIADLNQVYIQL